MRYTTSKAAKLFSLEGQNSWTPENLKQAQRDGKLKTFKKSKPQSWSSEEIPLVGEKMGFIKKPEKPIVMCVFVTKGGVLKSTLTINMARMAALHNIKTCVLGLDMQGDVTTTLGFDHGLSFELSLEEAIQKMNAIQGLPDLYYGNVEIEDLLQPTDLPTLQFIPETPELVSLEQNIMHRHRREFWLSDKVIEPLKEKFDLILIDCSPNWNQLITNALVACDTLVSPLECKINNFRNFKMFETFINDFKNDLKLNFHHIYVPTRLNPHRKLSREINEWYQENLPSCTKNCIKESIQGEEASALHLSLPEYAPVSPVAQDMKALCLEIWENHAKPFETQPSPVKYQGVAHGTVSQ